MTIQELDNSLRKAYSKETCHPSYRNKWSKDNPTAGHCAIVSLIVNDVFGYPIYNTFVGSSRHFYNMNGKDIIDLTKDQFNGVSVDYTKGVERNRNDLLKNKDTKERYELLKDRVLVIDEELDLMYNKKTIIEKFEEIEFGNENCHITNDLNDIVRDIKKNVSLRAEAKYIIDDNLHRYMELDPWFMIHNEAFDLAFDNGWYPELCYSNEKIEGKTPYDVYVEKGWFDGTLQFVKMMPLKYGETSSGYLGEEYFTKEYIYDGFSILTRNDLENCSLYKALGTPKEVLDSRKSKNESLCEGKQEDCTDEVEKVFGTTDAPTLGPTYILPNGKFLRIPTPQQMGLGGLVRYKCHPLIAAWLLYMKRVKGTLWDMNDIDPMLDWGSIRANVGELEDTEALINYMVLPKSRITDAQRNAILTYLDYAQTQHQPSFEVDTNRTSVGKVYNFKDYTSDDILGKIDKYYASGKLTESEGQDLSKYYDEELSRQLDKMNKFLDKYGFEVEVVDDEDCLQELKDKNAVGMFFNSIQDNASVFPIGFNKEMICNESENTTDVYYGIVGTLAHEVGHGIFEYCNDMMDLDDLDEEEVVEEFARDYEDNYWESNELMDILKQTLEEDLTQGQLDYFKDSKVRDSQGNLLVCYHGTHTPGFKEFDASKGDSKFGKYKFNSNYNVNYFTTDRKSAASYTEFGYENNGNVYACYVNIVNPYVVDNKTEAEIKSSFNIKDDTLRKHQIEMFDKVFEKWRGRYVSYGDEEFKELNNDLRRFNVELRPYGGYETDADPDDIEYFDLFTLGNNSLFGAEHPIMIEYSVDELFDDSMYDELREEVLGVSEEYGEDDYYFTTDDVVRYVLSLNETEGTDYDGILIPDIVDSMEMFSMRGTDVITLNSSRQIKLIDNPNPTDSKRIDEEEDEDEKTFDTIQEVIKDILG